MKWTPEQQKVIELRDRNILVSAEVEVQSNGVIEMKHEIWLDSPVSDYRRK